ncbi:hypothetical protein D3C75_1212630 [compost metagenome]
MTSALPPTINTSVPSMAAGLLPVTGASRKFPPRSSTAAAISFAKPGEMVLESTTVVPGLRTARIPSVP